ncbi:hypothetical protein F0562_008883 [Nyssa sinensis]|uniref:Uncharacterized protein n=1 Tax=Nyssa sinensis TaxID=561372 RepID=A0A5J5AA22_9ASTE|nr:hypothetical protein F0562_008883 [Nyssa sinensis]
MERHNNSTLSNGSKLSEFGKHNWNHYLVYKQGHKFSHPKVKKKQFFQNFFFIMLFGVIGVFISSLVIAAGYWWLFPMFGFVGLAASDYLGSTSRRDSFAVQPGLWGKEW